MTVDINSLPADRQSITQKEIAAAAVAYDEAQAAANYAKRDTEQARQELPASEWEDAKVEEAAIAAGKQPPAKRKHAEAHEQRIRDLEHREKVAQITARRKLQEFESACAQHGSDYLAECEAAVGACDTRWTELVGKLTTLANERTMVYHVARRLGADVLNISEIGFRTRDLNGLEPAAGQPKRVHLGIDAVLHGLEQLGKPEEPERAPAKPTTRPDQIEVHREPGRGIPQSDLERYWRTRGLMHEPEQVST